MLSRSISSTDAAPTPTARAAPDLGRERLALRRRERLRIAAPAIRRIRAKDDRRGNHRAAGRRDTHLVHARTRNAPALQSRRSRRRVARSGPSPDSVVEPEPKCRDRNGPPERAAPGMDQPGDAFRASARAPLPEGGGLADPPPQEVKLRAPRHAVPDDLDLLDPRLLTLNVRSTPTPEAIRRTVSERVIPPPVRRRMVPSKTWTRSRFPPRPWR